MKSDISDGFTNQILILAIAVTLVNTGFGIIFPVFPKLLSSIGGGDASDLGLLAATFGLSYLIGSPIFGNLADNFGKKRIIIVGLFGFIISNGIYLISSSLFMLYLARFVEGFFSSAIFAPSMALTIELSPEDKRGKYIGYLAASQTVGIIIGPVLGGFLFDGFTIYKYTLVGSLQLPFIGSIILGVLAWIWAIIKLPESEIKSKLFINNNKNTKFSDIIKHQLNVIPRPFHAFGIFIFAEILSISAWLAIEPGFIFYFYDELFFSASDFGLFVAVFGVVAVAGQSFLGNLSDRFGRKKVMIVGQLFSAIFYLALPSVKTLILIIIAVIPVGIGSGLRDPAMKALLSDVTENDTRATVFGIEGGLLGIAQIIAPIFGGFYYEYKGMNFMFNVAIFISIINIIVLSLIFFKRKELKTNEVISDIHVVTP